MFMEKGTAWCIIAIAGIMTFVLLGILSDIRWIMVAFMWICIVLPLSVAFFYFYYGMKPLNAMNCIEHDIIFDDDTLTLNAYASEENIS